jgi:hypothetical protein
MEKIRSPAPNPCGEWMPSKNIFCGSGKICIDVELFIGAPGLFVSELFYAAVAARFDPENLTVFPEFK